jgi:hypothetical protein
METLVTDTPTFLIRQPDMQFNIGFTCTVKTLLIKGD